MSENTNPTAEQLVRNVTFTIERSNIVPMPIDPTLQNEGEAADAKATGEAIEAVFTGATVNGKSYVSKAVTIYATDIPVSSESGAQSISAVLDSLSGKTAADVVYNTTTLETVKDALDGIKEEIDTELTEEQIDAIFDEVFEEDDE